jgi:hypothetical protein
MESLTALLLQDLKDTCEEQRGSNSMDYTTEVSNFGHYQLSEICFIYRTRYFDNGLFPNLQEIGTFWRGGRLDCSVDFVRTVWRGLKLLASAGNCILVPRHSRP